MRYNQKAYDLTIMTEKLAYQGVSRCCEHDWMETFYVQSRSVVTDEFDNKFDLSLPITGQLKRATDITKIHDEYIQELNGKQFLKRLLNKFR